MYDKNIQYLKKYKILTETKEQRVHCHRVNAEEHRTNQICSNHHDDCWNNDVVQSNLVHFAAQVSVGDGSHAQCDQHFGQEK